MRVALVGVPKSGKTKYAKEYAKEHDLKVVDNIPQRFAKSTDRVIGVGADYRVDYSLAGLRFAEFYKHENLVMTTTWLDSLAHTGYMADTRDLARAQADDDIEDLFDFGKSPYFGSSLVLTQFCLDSWLFDKTIFFPYGGRDEVLQKLDWYYSNFVRNLGIDYEIVGATNSPPTKETGGAEGEEVLP